MSIYGKNIRENRKIGARKLMTDYHSLNGGQSSVAETDLGRGIEPGHGRLKAKKLNPVL
jgi:hypothetical protein